MWPKRPRYFTTAMAMHCARRVVSQWRVACQWEGWHISWGWHIPLGVAYLWGFDFGPWLMRGWHLGGKECKTPESRPGLHSGVLHSFSDLSCPKLLKGWQNEPDKKFAEVSLEPMLDNMPTKKAQGKRTWTNLSAHFQATDKAILDQKEHNFVAQTEKHSHSCFQIHKHRHADKASVGDSNPRPLVCVPLCLENSIFQHVCSTRRDSKGQETLAFLFVQLLSHPLCNSVRRSSQSLGCLPQCLQVQLCKCRRLFTARCSASCATWDLGDTIMSASRPWTKNKKTSRRAFRNLRKLRQYQARVSSLTCTLEPKFTQNITSVQLICHPDHPGLENCCTREEGTCFWWPKWCIWQRHSSRRMSFWSPEQVRSPWPPPHQIFVDCIQIAAPPFPSVQTVSKTRQFPTQLWPRKRMQT